MKARRTVRKRHEDDDDMKGEYDFSRGVRGKYAAMFPPNTIAVVLAPDVAAVFKTARAVNEALRARLPGKRARKSGKGPARRAR